MYRTSSRYQGHQGYAGPSTSRSCYDTYCAFCNRTLDSEATRRTKCGHVLHLSCMNQHLPDTKKCPICGTFIKWFDITDKCTICFDYFVSGECKVIPDCGHEMHRECLKQWLATKSRCGICRKSLAHCEHIFDEDDENDNNGLYYNQDSEEYSNDEDYYYNQQNDYYSSSSQSEYENNLTPDDISTEEEYDYSNADDEYSDVDEDDQPIVNRQNRNANKEYHEKVCYYCSKTYESTVEPQKRLYCGHIFHLRCANEHLPKEKRCRVCDAPVKNWINTNDKCVRCWGKFENGVQRFTSICQHELHTSCRKAMRGNRCPLCKCKLEGNNSSDSGCAICLEPFLSSQEQYVTPCDHKYHEDCIETWLTVERICPICRENL